MRGCPISLCIGLFGLLACGVQAQWAESFDGWRDDGSYGTTATYVHPGVGTWVSYNALAGTQNARDGYAVRFDDDTPAPWLEFQGLDGNGVDGGVGTVSFYYRHWDGTSTEVAFQLQYRIGGGDWIDAGPEIDVPHDLQYRLFSHSPSLVANDITLRILSTASEERLLIDDLEIISSSAGEPRVGFVNTTQTIGESVGTLQAAIQISPAMSATVEVAVVAGDAIPGVDFSWAPTTLVFNAGTPVRDLSITVHDDGVVEDTEFVEWAITQAVGADIRPEEGRFSLTILDNDVIENTNDTTFTVLAANITSGSTQAYEAPGIRILRALAPDIVAIQEFNVNHARGHRGFVDDTFGTHYHFMVEDGDEQIPNGIVSRWPMIAWGEWNDPQVGNRDFAWASIDIPGDTDLHVISVHLHSSGGASSRELEAREIVSRVQSTFPANDYIVVAGDFNANLRTETCIQTLGSIFSDAHVPEDQFGDDDTNKGRSKPYDWVMPNDALDARNIAVTVGAGSFTDGIVFDTRLWAPPPAPALIGDSGEENMQHMAVMKAFSIPGEPPAPVNLIVDSSYGSPDPSIGVSTHAYGAILTPTMANSVITSGTTQHTLIGWTGTGSIPAAGSGSTVPTVTLIGPSTLTWHWQTHYRLNTIAATPGSQWVEAGDQRMIVPASSNYYTFAGWAGDIDPGQALDVPLDLVLDRPRTVTATFSPDLAARGTPHAWLAGYGWTNDFDGAEIRDTDGDGMAAWEEYVAGTFPDQFSSRFRVHGIAPGGTTDILCPTQPGRTYTIEYQDGSTGEGGTDSWHPFLSSARGMFSETGPGPSTHTFTDDQGAETTGAAPANGARSYRVRVQMP